jgi:hypothetical protein
MLGAGTVINPIIKIVTVIVVLGASYLFIVKPILDTTEDAIDKGLEQGREISEQSQQEFRNAQIQGARARANSYRDSLRNSWPAAAREVTACVQKGGDDLQALNRCVNFAQRLVHTVQSDRTFSLSYAQTLSAQGDSAAAARIEACVKQAGFEVAAMQRCRNLADDLLFG